MKPPTKRLASIGLRLTFRFCLVVGLARAGIAQEEKAAQPAPKPANRVPSIQFIQPPTAGVGRQVTWVVHGQNLQHARRWLISGEGIRIEAAKPATETEAELSVTTEAAAEVGVRELRALGDEGYSNLRLVRVDDLEPLAEVEPNDTPAQSQSLQAGTAVDANMSDKEYDYFHIDLKQGERVVFEVEAQRLGQPIVPVLTLFDSSGRALAQATETRGLDHDARLVVEPPRDGLYRLQVRDALFGGGERVYYRLRVIRGHAATAVFPLAAPRGSTVSLEASGGTLVTPLTRELHVAKDAPRWLPAGSFDDPNGPVVVPMRLFVTEESRDLLENSTSARPEGMPIDVGRPVNGRVSKPGEVDRYRVSVQKGKPVQVRIRASEMGSWLDSVVRVVDDNGVLQTENDDAGVNQPNQDGNPFNAQTPSQADSRLELASQTDAELTIEVFDRFGEGGPEYGYRLEVGPSEPDFQVGLLFGDPNLDRRRVIGQQTQLPRGPGSNGAINLKPGTSVPLNFLVTSDGGISKLQVRAEGLPEGVSAAPVNVTLPGSSRGRGRTVAMGGAIILRVAPGATANQGALRLVATAKPNPTAPEITRTAVARILLDTSAGTNPNAMGRFVSRDLESLPVWVAGRVAPIAAASGAAVPVAFREAVVPGVLLQGEHLDIPLLLEPPIPPASSFELAATAQAHGVVAQTLVTENPPAAATTPAHIRVIAKPDAPIGLVPVEVRFKSGAVEITRHLTVVVRAPARLATNANPIRFDAKSGLASVCVGVEREPGYRGPVSLQLKTPAGVRVVEPPPWTIEGDRLHLTLQAEDSVQTGQDTPLVLEIQAEALTSRGVAVLQSQKRSMFRGQVADENDNPASNTPARADVKPVGEL